MNYLETRFIPETEELQWKCQPPLKNLVGNRFGWPGPGKEQGMHQITEQNHKTGIGWVAVDMKSYMIFQPDRAEHRVMVYIE